MRYLFLLGFLVLFGCSYLPSGGERADTRDEKEKRLAESGTIFDEGGIFEGAAFNVGSQRIGPGQGGGSIGVNSYLWFASLETIDFLPISQVDPFGGVILSDWHSPTKTPDERVKLNIFINGKALRSDAIRVAMFREVRQNGDWISTENDPSTVRKIENAILKRARELRLQTIGSPE